MFNAAKRWNRRWRSEHRLGQPSGKGGRVAEEMDLAGLAAMMPLADALGIEIIEAGQDLVRARMAWAPERCTVGGALHGGALMTLADSAGAVCPFLNLPDGAVGTATIESKTNL